LDRVADKYRIGAEPGVLGDAVLVRAGPGAAAHADRARAARGGAGRDGVACSGGEGDFRVCVAMAETLHAVRREMHVGKIMPLQRRLGQPGAAGLGPEATAAALDGPLSRFTDLHHHRRRAAAHRPAADPRAGFASTAEERDAGAASVSAPVFDPQARLIAAESASPARPNGSPRSAATTVPPPCWTLAAAPPACSAGRTPA